MMTTMTLNRSRPGASAGEAADPPDTTAPGGDLLARARAGDRRAVEALLLPDEPVLRALCRRALQGTGEDPEDAVQEAYYRAIRALPEYRGDAELRTWLARIALNVCLELRRRRSRVAPDDEARPVAEEVDARALSPEGQAVRRGMLDEALACLTPVQRTAFLLKEAEGWSLAEVGAAHGWSVMRVKVELYRARRKLGAWARRVEEEEGRQG